MKQQPTAGIKAPKLSRKAMFKELPTRQLQSREQYRNLSLSQANFVDQHAERIIIEEAQLSHVVMSNTCLSQLEMLDVRCTDCNFCNAEWSVAILQRVEMRGCQMTGLRLIEARLQDTFFKECEGKFAQFRFATFKDARFENCDLSEADFQGADLSGVSFINCKLSHAEMSGAKLAGANLRSSNLDGLRVSPKELQGAIINPAYAIALVQSLGIVVE